MRASKPASGGAGPVGTKAGPRWSVTSHRDLRVAPAAALMVSATGSSNMNAEVNVALIGSVTAGSMGPPVSSTRMRGHTKGSSKSASVRSSAAVIRVTVSAIRRLP